MVEIHVLAHSSEPQSCIIISGLVPLVGVTLGEQFCGEDPGKTLLQRPCNPPSQYFFFNQA